MTVKIDAATEQLTKLLKDKKKYEAKLKAVKSDIGYYSDIVNVFMEENGLEDFKRENIKATRKGKERYTIDDYEEVAVHILETEDVEIFERRLSKAYLDEYREEHDGKLPPGIDVAEYTDIKITLTGGKK